MSDNKLVVKPTRISRKNHHKNVQGYLLKDYHCDKI